jgi:hypothetical protein
MKGTLKSITIVQDTGDTPMLMRRYRVWFEDSVEPEVGFWWNCLMDENGCLYDPAYPNDEDRDTLQWYIDNGYKVEKL